MIIDYMSMIVDYECLCLWIRIKLWFWICELFGQGLQASSWFKQIWCLMIAYKGCLAQAYMVHELVNYA